MMEKELSFIKDLKVLIAEDDAKNEKAQQIMDGELSSLDNIDKAFTLGRIDKLQGRRHAIEQVKALLAKHNLA